MTVALKHVTSLKMTMQHDGASLNIIDSQLQLSPSDNKMATRMTSEPITVLGGFVAFTFDGEKNKHFVGLKGPRLGPLCLLDEPKVMIGPKGPETPPKDGKDVKDGEKGGNGKNGRISRIRFPSDMLIICMAGELFEKCCALDPNYLAVAPVLEQIIIARLEDHLHKVFAEFHGHLNEDTELQTLCKKLAKGTITQDEEKELRLSANFYLTCCNISDLLAILSCVNPNTVKDVSIYHQLVSGTSKEYDAILQQYTLFFLKEWGTY